MFQDIAPHSFDNQYLPRQARASDYLIIVDEGQILLCEHEGELSLPHWGDFLEYRTELIESLQYLFSLDDIGFFLSFSKVKLPHCSYRELRLDTLPQDWLSFAANTALHLATWYTSHRFCGRCGSAMQPSASERALVCPSCGQIEYPKIAPVVIVAVTNGDELLLTKANSGVYRRHALVSGFVEIGETLEEAAHREVMEEVGLRIKNLRYFANQPWPMSESILMGFFAEVDGATHITLDTTELSEAGWYKREEIPTDYRTYSLTWTMIDHFRRGGSA